MSDEPRKVGGMAFPGSDVPGRGNQITGRLVVGLIVFSLGALWTLDNLGFIESEPILDWWPALLVLFGLSRLVGLWSRPQPVAGVVFTLVGLALLGNQLDWFAFHLWQLWPLVLILIGASLVMRSIRGPGSPAGSADRNSEVHTFAMMAGIHQKCESQDFRGGDASALMGGAEIDLRAARTTQPQVVIDVFAWWGGIDIFVPRDWRVVSEVVPIMGGVEDQSKPVEGAAHTTLILRGAAIMGGIEIKN